MMVIRLEQDTLAQRQRVEHRLDEPTQYADGPRAQLARELADFWRPDHRPQTLREEINRREAGPRGFLAEQLRNAHIGESAEEMNRRDDAMNDSGLNAREKLAIETRDMWRGSK